MGNLNKCKVSIYLTLNILCIIIIIIILCMYIYKALLFTNQDFKLIFMWIPTTGSKDPIWGNDQLYVFRQSPIWDLLGGFPQLAHYTSIKLFCWQPMDPWKAYVNQNVILCIGINYLAYYYIIRSAVAQMQSHYFTVWSLAE